MKLFHGLYQKIIQKILNMNDTGEAHQLYKYFHVQCNTLVITFRIDHQGHRVKQVFSFLHLDFPHAQIFTVY